MRDIILEKLERQHHKNANPIITFVDFDGTCFTAGRTMWKAPYYNRKTMRILRHEHIPFIIVTGRADWNKLAELEARTCGVMMIDAVIAGAGSVIYVRDQYGALIKDLNWKDMLSESTITVNTHDHIIKNADWSREELVRQVKNSPFFSELRISHKEDNEFVVRYMVKKIPIKHLENIKTHLNHLFPQGVKILIAEALLQKNTITLFSGDILLVPSLAGKDRAVCHILEQYADQLGIILRGICFGDSSIDITMLTMPEDVNRYQLEQYGVHLQPRTNKLLKEVAKTNYHLKILAQEGPSALYQILKQLTLKLQEHALSPAQNNRARSFLYPIEGLLDQIHDDALSANDISFLGLRTVIDSINKLYCSQHKTKLTILQAIAQYSYGNFTDILDGIRARRTPLPSSAYASQVKGTNNTAEGQLIDVFCDRVKEFYQLYIRAEKRFLYSPFITPAQPTDIATPNYEAGYITALTAISCILPSIARAQSEVAGKIVKEYDEHGGSMLSRTKKLFQSLLLDVTGKQMKSFVIDKKIYENNRATFAHRLNATKTIFENQDINKLTAFQKEALQRWLTLIRLLQEEDTMILEMLRQYPHYFYSYDHQFRKNLEPYLKLSVRKLCNLWQCTIPDLHINMFIPSHR